MSACRIARRVTSMSRRQNPYTEAVSAKTLVRKVFHYQCHLFFPWCGGCWAGRDAEQWMVARFGSEWLSTGARRSPWRGGARRVVCWVTSFVTPFITPSLVTKEKNGDVE
jgi:hypothetical protein